MQYVNADRLLLLYLQLPNLLLKPRGVLRAGFLRGRSLLPKELQIVSCFKTSYRIYLCLYWRGSFKVPKKNKCCTFDSTTSFLCVLLKLSFEACCFKTQQNYCLFLFLSSFSCWKRWCWLSIDNVMRLDSVSHFRWINSHANRADRYTGIMMRD